MIDPTDDFFKKVVEHFGFGAQLNKLKEELFELGVAICHMQDNKASEEDLIEEMIDVMILFGQIFAVKDKPNLFEATWAKKIKRLSERIGIPIDFQDHQSKL